MFVETATYLIWDRLGIPRPVAASMLIKTTNAFVAAGCVLLTLLCGVSVSPQVRTYPKEIRDYKVERTVVEIKKPETKTQQSSNRRSENDGVAQGNSAANSDAYVDELIQLGKPELTRVTPLGITFEVPIVVSPVKQNGHVDFLVFEDMVVNGTSVNIDEYHRAFDLPNKQPLTLHEPLSFYIYLPSAMLAALGDWSDAKETWPVTGRVYVFGKFKKGPFSFKRVVPVELNLTMRNPLRER
ncbi:MAG: hypothetical protein QOE96_1265 [Blastocatellia bacterium]|jgi:hypothetical protein|nr:hypothetical protein [Blastocatellia bacterium]